MDTTEIICTGPVTNLTELIEVCNFPEEALFLAEQLPSHIVKQKQKQDLLRFAHLRDVKNAQDYTSGRIFSDTFELRWEKENGGDYHVVYFGIDREIVGLTKNEEESENIRHYKVDTKQYYLFGEHLEASQLQDMKIEAASKGNSYYATVRIPRLLLYPRQSGAKRLQLLVREYLDEATSRVRLFRFQDLVDANENRGEARA